MVDSSTEKAVLLLEELNKKVDAIIGIMQTPENKTDRQGSWNDCDRGRCA